ncbi:MAG: hypothetical protein AB7J35_16735 [Dehalococcoidia bacterium]
MAAIALLGAVALAACGDDDDGGGNSAASANAEVLNAIAFIDGAGLHAIDESINTDKTVPATAKTTSDKVQTVLNITTWPKDLQSQAKALSDIMAGLSASLEGDKPDLAKAGEAATKAHEGSHDFSHAVWDYLYKQGGVADSDAAHAD